MKKIFKVELIEKFMKENKLSVNGFCNKCNITRYAYNQIIKQDINIYISNLFKVAFSIGIELIDLFE